MFAWRAAKRVATGGRDGPRHENSTDAHAGEGQRETEMEPESSFVSLEVGGLGERPASAPPDLSARATATSSGRSNSADTELLRTHSRLSAMSSMRNRGAIGLTVDRYIEAAEMSARARISREDLSGVLSQFSPYLAATPGSTTREAADLGAPGGGKSVAPNLSSSAEDAEASENLGCLPALPHGEPREKDFLPTHLHGAPTVSATRTALEMFQNMHVYDSQNYEPSDSRLDRIAALGLPRSHYIASSAYRWCLALLIGVSMGLVSFCMLSVMELLVRARVGFTESLAQEREDASAVSFYVLLAVALALVAALPVALVCPIAGGSGIAEMKVYLNGIHVPGLLRVTTFACKAFSMCLSIPSGMVLGTAGPYVHLGGIVGGGLGSLGSNQFKFKLNKGHVDFQSKFAHRSFVTMGIAAGVATVFTAPIGGVLIAFEDCGSFYLGSTKMFWQCFLATCSGVFVNQLLRLSVKHGDLSFFDTTKYTRAFALYMDSDADYAQVYRFTWWEVLVFALMGCVAGLLGSAFVKMHMWVHRTRWRLNPTPWGRVAEAVMIAALTAGIAITIGRFSPCSPLPEDVQDYPTTTATTADSANGSSSYQNPHMDGLWCPEGQYSAYGTLFLTPAGVSLKEVLHLGQTVDNPNQFEWGALASYSVFVFFGLALSYGCAVSGGTMVPLLTAGACYGRLCAKIVRVALQSAGNEAAASAISHTTYAVVGAAVLQSGASRMTMSIAVLVLETCGALELTVPLMIAIFFAKAVGDLTGTGLYDAYIALKGVPYLPEDEISYEQKMIAEKLDVQEVMTSDLVCLPPLPTVGHVVRILKTYKHNAFPVVEADSEGEGSGLGDEGEKSEAGFPVRNMVGYVFRSQILSMLDKGIGFLDQDEACYNVDTAGKEEVLRMVEDLKNVPVKRDARAQGEVISSLSQEDVECRLDLRPFMQLDPCIVSSTANVAKAYRLFQKMGLSHLYVAPPGPRRVIGVITRKDLTFENCQLQLGERASFEMKSVARAQGGDDPPSLTTSGSVSRSRVTGRELDGEPGLENDGGKELWRVSGRHRRRR